MYQNIFYTFNLYLPLKYKNIALRLQKNSFNVPANNLFEMLKG